MTSRRILTLLLGAAVIAAAPPILARTATAAERAACEARIQPRIDAINARLRAGYTAREGETLRAQRRKLEARLAACRKA